jgi:hypothetical protein
MGQRSAMAAAVIAIGALAACGGNGGEASVQSAASSIETEQTATTATVSTGATTEAVAEIEPVQDFVLRVNDYINKGQWGRAWALLHPAQRKLLSANDLADCMEGASVAANFGSEAKLQIEEIYDEPWEIPGTKVTEPSKAITLKAVMNYEEGGEKIETELGQFTQHAFRVGDHWTWIVSQEVTDLLQDDLC